MKRIDFENGTVTENILSAALPMLAAQILSLLYNIVDRIYIGRIPNIGTTALGAVGLCFPLIMIITACSNLFGSGGAPLFSINRGKCDKEQANRILNTSFSMVCASALLLMGTGLLFAKPLLILFGASKKCSDFCQTLYDAVSARYTSIHDCYRHEPFYQCTGVFHNRDVFRGNRCNRKHSPGSALYFYLPSGRKRCSGRHCIVTDFICTVCVSFSAPQSGDQSPPASKK